MQQAAALLKKRLWHSCFPVNFVKFLRAPFLQHLWATDSVFFFPFEHDFLQANMKMFHFVKLEKIIEVKLKKKNLFSCINIWIWRQWNILSCD